MIIGHSVKRVDALSKVTGSSVYGADVFLHGMLHGKVLRSPYAHARIVKIDISRARDLPGVRVVVTGEDLPGVKGGEAVQDMPFLAQEKVRFVGEPVAAVAAEDEETAAIALGLIKVEYEELPAVFDPVQAMEKGAPLIHEGLENYHRIPVVKPVAGTNIITVDEYTKGDVDQGFREADYIFEDTFRSHTVQHAPLEPHSAVAQIAVDGKITIWVPNDSPHRLRKDLADALHIPLTQIRVISTYIGGGFGCKGGLKVEPIAYLLAKKANGRPVKIVLSREEEFQAMLVRHATVTTIKTGIKRDGTLVAREVKVVWDTGAYAEKGPTVCRQTTATAAGPYKIPHTRLIGYCVYTNKIVAGAYRGYGTPQVAWAYESQMDMIARKLGIDPLELRLKNIIRDGDINPFGQKMSSVGVEECLHQAADAIGWGTPNVNPAGAGGKKRIGRGIACGSKNTKTPSGAAAVMYLNQDGTINVLTSTVEVGQGSTTIIAQIAAEVLGVPVEMINVSTPDTDFTPFDASTTSSRSTFHMGNAVKMAAEDLARQLCEIAAGVFGCSPDLLEAAGGMIRPKGTIDNVDIPPISYYALMKKKYRAGGTVTGHGFFYPEFEQEGTFSAHSVFWMYTANAAEVEVDMQTGKVRVLRFATGLDVGKPINLQNCLQQLEGGAVHGIGTVLTEEVIFDQKGQVLNPNFHDYKIPTAMDVPEILPRIVEVPDPNGPFGAKGVGEVITTPTMAVIANAIEDAVGVRIKDLPITAEKVLQAIEQKKQAKG
ncbi:hypothetical protein SY88_16635 [Clostridiales bacterium PH28_bin88]|nr:hypothetical protein SY88_16635 [Clostridiales bacterium PH28_bin88]